MKTIGTNIAYFRKKAGMTQEELSEKMNVTSQAISKWENDLSYPDLPSVKKLADVLRVSTDEIFGGERSIPVETDAGEQQIERRIMVIRVRNEDDEAPGGKPLRVEVRYPVSQLLKAKENGTLRELVGGREASSVEMAIGMIREGVVGTLVDVQAEGYTVRITVEDYES